MAVFLGVLVAAAFGSGDFLGGRAAANAATSMVLTVSQLTGAVLAVVVVAFVGARVAPHDIVYGACAGAVTVVGLALLYRGLAANAAVVVAPMTAVVAAIVPITWGLAHGERPSVVVLIGAAAAIVAVALIAREPERAAGTRMRLAEGALIAITAGLALGTSLIFYDSTSTPSGMWPVLAARLTALLLVVVVFGALRLRGAIARPTGRWRIPAVVAGTLDATATLLVLVAVRHGLIVVVAPVAALAPAFTVMLSTYVLHERLHTGQRLGLVLALIGLVLVAAG